MELSPLQIGACNSKDVTEIGDIQLCSKYKSTNVINLVKSLFRFEHLRLPSNKWVKPTVNILDFALVGSKLDSDLLLPFGEI